MADADVIVVGAGIIGAACAWKLAGEGLRVVLVDNRQPGATGAGMGHLVCMDDNSAELALSAYSLRLWRELVSQMPERCSWQGCGTLWIAESADDMVVAEQKRRNMAAVGEQAELLTPAQVATLEPMLRSGLHGGLRAPGDGIVYAPNVARWLVDQAGEAVSVITGDVVGLEDNGVALADGRNIHAGTLVLACGPGANRLLAYPILRVKKGHLAITDRYPPCVRHQLVELGYGASAHAGGGTSVAFNVQARPTGQLLIGSSRQFDVEDPAVEMPLLAAMLSRATSFLPRLAQMNIIRCWTGQRAASVDGQPLLGPHPGRMGLWLALGHEGLGVTTALGSAALLAAQILGQRPEIDEKPYLPSRLWTERGWTA